MYRSTQPRLRGASHRLGHCKWPMRLDICMPSDSASVFGSLSRPRSQGGEGTGRPWARQSGQDVWLT